MAAPAPGSSGMWVSPQLVGGFAVGSLVTAGVCFWLWPNSPEHKPKRTLTIHAPEPEPEQESFSDPAPHTAKESVAWGSPRVHLPTHGAIGAATSSSSPGRDPATARRASTAPRFQRSSDGQSARNNVHGSHSSRRRRASLLDHVGSMDRHGGNRTLQGFSTLRQVIVVLRHGARLPNHPLPNDISWPESDEFFERYKGSLSPQGVLQHINLGDTLREKYVLGSRLFDGVRLMDVGSHVKVVTSNFQRTLFSAWSLLYGLFPGIPCSFKLPSERFNIDYSEIRKLYSDKNLTTGIPIMVQESNMDVILRQWKRDESYKKWKKRNLTGSVQFAEFAQDPEVEKLLAKVFMMTGLEQLHPSEPMLNRLFKLTSVATQVNIARAHNLIPLANASGLLLSQEEEALLFRIAKVSWRHWFTNTSSDRVSDSPGRLAAGMLLHEIWRDMDNMVHKTAPATNKVVVYSAHDSTLLAMQSRMGIKVTTTPSFAAHYVFELHETSRNSFEVRFLYNPNPDKVDEWDLVSRQQNVSECFVSFDELPLGATPFGTFARRFRLCAVDAVQGSSLLRNRNHMDVLRSFVSKRALPFVRARILQRKRCEEAARIAQRHLSAGLDISS